MKYLGEISDDKDLVTAKWVKDKINEYTEIPANADLNNYTTVGKYICRLDSIATTIKNKPVGINYAFALIIVPTAEGAFKQFVFQYFTARPLMVSRNNYSGTFGPWCQIYDEYNKPTLEELTANADVSVNNHKILNLAAPTNNTDAANKQYVDDKLSEYTEIPANADLNDYLTQGKYVCLTTVTSNTIANRPPNIINGSFALIVIQTGVMGQSYKQIFFHFNSRFPYIVTRSYYYEFGFGPWCQIYDEYNKPTLEELTANADVSVNNHKILNLAAPTNNTDAANKQYVDDKLSGSSDLSFDNPVFTGSISMGRASGTTIGQNSVAVGNSVEASNTDAHAEGINTKALAAHSHAEGNETTASNMAAHAEGQLTEASGVAAHAEGYNTTASGKYSHAEGYNSYVTGEYAHGEGYHGIATGKRSHAEGNESKASVDDAHAEGLKTLAEGIGSHSEGILTTASNYGSHAGGKCNKKMTTGATLANSTGDAMVIGNGTETTALSNCFRVTYKGEVYGLSSFKSSGADYAEYFEWEDGNLNAEDRVGYFVTLNNDKIIKAKSGDYILGIVSAQPCVIGNADEDWLGRWEHDEFGRFIKEYLVEEETEIKISETDNILDIMSNPNIHEKDGKYYEITSRVVDYETPSWRYKANKNYDNTQTYIERQDRKEWDAIGMIGVLAVRDDGTCKVNSFACVSDNGIATATSEYISGQTYRVISRVSDNVIKVVFH